MSDALQLFRIADHHLSRADFDGAPGVLALLRIVTGALRPAAGKLPGAVFDAVRQLPPIDGAAVALRLAAESINTIDEVSVGAREFAEMYAALVGSLASDSVHVLADRIARQKKCCRCGDDN